MTEENRGRDPADAKRYGSAGFDGGSRLARWRGLLGLAGRRVLTRATRTAPRQVALTVAGIALPVALALLVTSVSLGLASGTTVRSADVDYWIVPESGSATSVVPVSGPQFGRVHRVSDRLTARDDVTYATPVLLELLRARSGSSEATVLVLGAIPPPEPIRLAGVSTAGLTPGDPVYANGTYAGEATDEAILSGGAADLLNASKGSRVRLQAGDANRSFAVANVSRGGEAVLGGAPVVLVHLGELQTLVGDAGEDRADQILVRTTDPDVESALGRIYPHSLVVSGTGFGTRQVLDSELPLAVALAALVVSIVVGVLFAASTIGLSIATDVRFRSVLAALGFSARSRATLVATQTLLVALLGGVIGVALGLVGTPLADALAARYAGRSLVEFHPLLAVYGVGIALLIGGCTVPYVLFVSRRTGDRGVLRE